MWYCKCACLACLYQKRLCHWRRLLVLFLWRWFEEARIQMSTMRLMFSMIGHSLFIYMCKIKGSELITVWYQTLIRNIKPFQEIWSSVTHFSGPNYHSVFTVRFPSKNLKTYALKFYYPFILYKRMLFFSSWLYDLEHHFRMVGNIFRIQPHIFKITLYINFLTSICFDVIQRTLQENWYK